MYGRLLAGPLIGSFVFVNDSDAAKGVADGWLDDMAGAAYPFPWQRGIPETAPPQSYTDWADAGYPTGEGGPQEIPVPTITSMNPSGTTAGVDVTATVIGTGYVRNVSQMVSEGGVALVTTFVSPTELSVHVHGTSQGGFALTVQNDTDKVSNEVIFNIA